MATESEPFGSHLSPRHNQIVINHGFVGRLMSGRVLGEVTELLGGGVVTINRSDHLLLPDYVSDGQGFTAKRRVFGPSTQVQIEGIDSDPQRARQWAAVRTYAQVAGGDDGRLVLGPYGTDYDIPVQGRRVRTWERLDESRLPRGMQLVHFPGQARGEAYIQVKGPNLMTALAQVALDLKRVFPQWDTLTSELSSRSFGPDVAAGIVGAPEGSYYDVENAFQTAYEKETPPEAGRYMLNRLRELQESAGS